MPSLTRDLLAAGEANADGARAGGGIELSGGTVTVDWGRVEQKKDHDVVFSSARPRSPAPLSERVLGPQDQDPDLV